MTPFNFDDRKMRHLDYIQNIISRLNSNSFIIKGWCITIVSAVLALLATTQNKSFIAVTALPILIFWVLDSFYLQAERKYAVLYKKVIDPESSIPPFSLDINSAEIVKEPGTKYTSSLFSRTTKIFYFSLLIVSAACTFFIATTDVRMSARDFNWKQDTINVKPINLGKPLLPDSSRQLNTK